jgi:hypothetical protein
LSKSDEEWNTHLLDDIGGDLEPKTLDWAGHLLVLIDRAFRWGRVSSKSGQSASEGGAAEKWKRAYRALDFFPFALSMASVCRRAISASTCNKL